MSPLRKTCTYAIKSQVEFKSEFLKVQSIFDSRDHEIFTLDVQSLFPNINNTRTFNFILNEVFKDIKVYFFDKTKKAMSFLRLRGLNFENFYMGSSIILIFLSAKLARLPRKNAWKGGRPIVHFLLAFFLEFLREPW